MSRRQTVIGLIACAAIAAGCGDDDLRARAIARTRRKPVSTAARHAQLKKNPYDLRCADLRDKLASADITRTVQNAPRKRRPRSAA